MLGDFVNTSVAATVIDTRECVSKDSISERDRCAGRKRYRHRKAARPRRRGRWRASTRSTRLYDPREDRGTLDEGRKDHYSGTAQCFGHHDRISPIPDQISARRNGESEYPGGTFFSP